MECHIPYQCLGSSPTLLPIPASCLMRNLERQLAGSQVLRSLHPHRRSRSSSRLLAWPGWSSGIVRNWRMNQRIDLLSVSVTLTLCLYICLPNLKSESLKNKLWLIGKLGLYSLVFGRHLSKTSKMCLSLVNERTDYIWNQP